MYVLVLGVSPVGDSDLLVSVVKRKESIVEHGWANQVDVGLVETESTGLQVLFPEHKRFGPNVHTSRLTIAAREVQDEWFEVKVQTLLTVTDLDLVVADTGSIEVLGQSVRNIFLKVQGSRTSVENDRNVCFDLGSVDHNRVEVESKGSSLGPVQEFQVVSFILFMVNTTKDESKLFFVGDSPNRVGFLSNVAALP